MLRALPVALGDLWEGTVFGLPSDRGNARAIEAWQYTDAGEARTPLFLGYSRQGAPGEHSEQPVVAVTRSHVRSALAEWRFQGRRGLWVGATVNFVGLLLFVQDLYYWCVPGVSNVVGTMPGSLAWLPPSLGPGGVYDRYGLGPSDLRWVRGFLGHLGFFLPRAWDGAGREGREGTGSPHAPPRGGVRLRHQVPSAIGNGLLWSGRLYGPRNGQ